MLKYYIYELSDPAGNKKYIGSTKDIPQRMQTHCCGETHRTKKTMLLYQYAAANGGISSFNLCVIREVLVNSKTEARVQEQIEIAKIPKDLLLNSQKAYLTTAQRKLDHSLTNQSWYQRKRQDTQWMAKKRERQRIYKAKLKAKKQPTESNVETTALVDIPLGS